MKLDLSCIFTKAGSQRLVDALPNYESICVKCLSQEHSDPLPSLGAKPIVSNRAIANLRSYQLSLTEAKVICRQRQSYMQLI